MNTPTTWQDSTLENEIVSLFSQKFALTHRILTKLREFDESEGWSGFASCAEWLAFRVGITKSAANEKVRAARALKELPQMDAALSVGTISYSKVRALTRIATAENEGDLLGIAEHATAAQIVKLVCGWRTIDRLDEEKRDEKRSCEMHTEDDGMCVVFARLRPEEGALIAKALEAAREKGRSLADALVAMAERSLSATETKSDERYQVIVHTEASFTAATVEGRFAEKTPISAEVLRKLSCDATMRTVTHGTDGSVLDVGRKTRVISTKLRIALAQRDHGCRFPGCTHQYVDAHHVRHWANGGETNLANLMSLCGFHHGQLHDGKIVLGEDLVFRYANGRPITHALPATRATPAPERSRTMPIASGERLDLGYALACLRYEPSAPSW